MARKIMYKPGRTKMEITTAPHEFRSAGFSPNDAVENGLTPIEYLFCRARCGIPHHWIESSNGERPMSTTKEFPLPKGEC
jgi:hypothetical protein